jgi:hypothetical protein
MGASVRFNHIGSQFAGDDVGKAVGCHAAALGFKLDFLDGDPPHYAVVFRDEVYIHFCEPQPPEFTAGSGRAFAALSGVDTIWKRVLSKAPDAIKQAIRDLDYGHQVLFRVFSISDPAREAKEIGGTGRTHDWALSRVIRDEVGIPVWLAGGLTPDNVAEAVRTMRPYGVDTCTGLRTDDRLDERKLARFVRELRVAGVSG